jgi:hypothetical protein
LFLVQYSWGQALFIIIVLQFVGSALWIFLWFGILYGCPDNQLGVSEDMVLSDTIVMLVAYSHLLCGVFVSLY